MNVKDTVIVSACRTPIGKLFGQFKDITARELAIAAGKEAIKRAGVEPHVVDEIVMGEVLSGMQGSLPAMQVGHRIGLGSHAVGVTINQNCASGMRALEIASDHIMVGKATVVLVVGVESMSTAPYLLDKARSGFRMNDGTVYDSMTHDALIDELTPGHMGITAENVAEMYGITREECDELAVMSHNRAVQAIDAGNFKEEIVPIVLKSKRGDTIIDTDEHPIRGTSMESLSTLKPVFKAGGVVTAANASGVNDAAAACIVMSAEKAAELGVTPLAHIVHICSAGVEPRIMGVGPAKAIPKVLLAAGVRFQDVECWEINEAFAAQFIGAGRMLKEEAGMELNMADVNRNGSGISLGHPIG
ncbi:MAG: thiolase family protein [Treponema sp.]|nr:thiolase family protein [Treponema sp.]